MPKRRVLQGEARAVARGGEAVVQTEEGIVFVPGALPAESVELELSSPKRGAARGRLTRILRASEARIEAPCDLASRCGGCPLMIANTELQREIKRSFLRDACRGVPGADEVKVTWVASPEPFEYRRRARLAWADGALGYRRRRSKRVTDVLECVVLAPPLQRAWADAREHLGSALRGTGNIQLQRTAADRVVVELTTHDDQPPALFRACAELTNCQAVAGVTLRISEAHAAATWGEPEIEIDTPGGTLRAPPGSFSQANEAVNAELIRAVIDLADPEGRRVLELHSGVGNFTVGLAARGPKTLVAVERDAAAAAACRANLARNGLDARVVVGDANRPPKGRFDVCVLDPPRQGARRLFERGGPFPGPTRVVYVSCDTATLARDLNLAALAGYRIDRILGFDMFPQTAHLESVVRLVRMEAS